jgi:hypothetical protein
MKGAISPFPLHAFMACMGETLPLPFSNRKTTLGKLCLLFLIPLISKELFN